MEVLKTTVRFSVAITMLNPSLPLKMVGFPNENNQKNTKDQIML